MNTPVKFETAKLLKEKGFDKRCLHLWHYNGSDCISMPNKNSENFGYSAPTIADVVMWLYEKHGIWISVDMVFDEHQTGFWHCIRQSKIDDIAIQSDDYLKITEAYEAAIEYTLNNLI